MIVYEKMCCHRYTYSIIHNDRHFQAQKIMGKRKEMNLYQ